MPIINYPDAPGGYVNRIDQASKSNRNRIAIGSADLTTDTLSLRVTNLWEAWRIKEIAFSFTNANARTFTISKVSGLGIITHRNDYFWLAHTDVVAQRIIITPGFYRTDASFTAEVKSQLDSNAAFAAAGITFTVAHDLDTRLFSITPSSGQVKYVYDNTSQSARTKSIASPVLGFTADTVFGAAATGTVPVDLDVEYVVDSNVGDTSTTYLFTDALEMDLDSELLITSNTGVGVIITAKVTYVEL